MRSDRGYRWWMLLDKLFTIFTPVFALLIAAAALAAILHKGMG
jgi:hypothetical protein